MSVGTEQVFIMNSTEIQPTSLESDFTIPVEALEPEDVGDASNLCTGGQNNMAHQTTNMPPQSQMCRLCATITEFVVPIFEVEGLQNRLADKIHQHLPIQVSQSDILPTVMCFQCTSTLLAWHELVMCSVQADNAMRERYNLDLSQPKGQLQPDNSAIQSGIKHEKSDRSGAKSPRVNVPCEYCSHDVPDSDLRSHLLAKHAARLYLCAECHLYRNKETMMLHMGKHIEADENEPNEPEKVESVPTPNIVIPVVRIQRVPSELPAPPETDIPLSPRSQETPSVEYPPPPVVNDSNTSEDLSSEGSKPVLLLLRAAESVELNHNQNVAPPSYSESMRISERMKVENPHADTKNDTPSCVEPGHVEKVSLESKTSPENVTIDLSPKRDEFSDHSDIENEFGRLPASVFDAFEDTEDGHSNTEERQSPDTPTDLSENKTESKKSTPSRSCPVCGKTYASVSSWYYHMKHAHVVDKELACDTCDKVFASKERLAVHKRTHTNDKPFACKVCGKGFSSTAGRYIHEQRHTERKEYSCAQCGRAFRWRAQLKRHEARHAKKREFVCTVCGQGFSVGFDLIRHARCHAPGCHECDLCGSKFKQKRYLKVHMENKHFAQTARAVANVKPDSKLGS